MMTATLRDLPTRQVTLATPDGGEHTFEGTRLGFGTSHRASHLNHPPDAVPRPGERCSGCRWTDASIYWSATAGKYIVHTVGRSVVPGEVNKVKIVWTDDADAVLDSLLVAVPRKHRDASSDPSALELPQPNAHALEEAAERDPELARTFRSWSEPDG